MKLYHGINEKVAKKALTEGILPRGKSDNEGNWQHSIQSHHDTVYLTDTYAPFYALSSTPTDETFKMRWAIIEIDTDWLWEDKFWPDEDYLEQAHRFGIESFGEQIETVLATKVSMEDRTVFFRDHLGVFSDRWEESLRVLGNCCHYGRIPPNAITRIALYDPQSNPYISMRACDPSISILNHMVCAEQYHALTSWFFKEANAEQVIGPLYAQMLPISQLLQAKEALDQTDGLEIITP